MKVLMTGASGFVGSALIDRMTDDFDVVGLTRSGSNRASTRIDWVEADLAQPLVRDHLPSQIDVVVHSAVSEHHRDFPSRGLDLFRVNTASTAELLDYATAAGAKHFVYVSSGSVYPGDISTQEEADLAMPDSALGATKLAAEMLVHQYQQVFRTYSPRLYFPYGPGQEARLIPSIIDRVQTGAPVQVAGGNGLLLPPTHISDVAEVLYQSLTSDWSGAMNVAAPTVLSLREIAETIGAIVGREPVFEVVDGTAPEFCPDLARLQHVVATDGFTSFADGVRSLVAGAMHG